LGKTKRTKPITGVVVQVCFLDNTVYNPTKYSMGVTKEQVQLYVNSLYGLLLGDEVKRTAILDGIKSVIKKSPKLSTVRKGQIMAILTIMQQPTVTSLINPCTLLVMMKKHWAHRKAVTSRLIPQLTDTDEVDNTVVASVLRVVLKHLSVDEIDRFYNLLYKVIQFAEPHARAEKWDQAKPLVEFDKWVPLSDYLAELNGVDKTPAQPKDEQREQRHDGGGGESGPSGCSGTGVQSDEGHKKGKGKRACPKDATAANPRQRQRGGRPAKGEKA
jgi:hypothetical protein